MSWTREKLLLFAAFAFFVASIANNYFYLLLTVIACFGISLFLIYKVIGNVHISRFYLLSSLAGGAWVSAGFIQSASYFVREYRPFASLFYASSVKIDVRDYALAFSYVFLFIAASSLLSRFSFVTYSEKIFEYYCIRKLRLISLRSWSLILVSVIVVLFVVSFLGLISMRGLGAEHLSDQGIIPWWYVMITFLISALPLLISQVLSCRKKIFSSPILIAIIGFIVGLYYSSLSGRFATVAFLLLIPFSWLVIQRPPLRISLRIVLTAIFGGLAVLSLFSYINIFFVFLNTTREQQGVYTNPLIFLQSFLDFASSPNIVSQALDNSDENLVSRPLLLWPLAASIHMVAEGLNSDYLYFADFFSSIQNSLPRFIIPWKGELIFSEELLYSRFPFASVDTADSPYLYSFASFGILGVLFYPIVIAAIYSLFLRFIVFCSQYGVSLVPAIASSIMLINFAIISYGELSTTALLRNFIVPVAISSFSLVTGFLVVTRTRVISTKI